MKSIQFFLLALFLSLITAEKEKTLPFSGLPFLGQTLLQPSFLGNAGTQNISSPLGQFQINNLLSLFQNISQLLTSGQNGTSPIPGKQRFGPIPQNPIFTTLPFSNLTSEELTWFWEGNTYDKGNSEEGAVNANQSEKPSTKFFGNSGRNTTYADLNFLTIPQLFNVLGRR